jgi:hypothetical protein
MANGEMALFRSSSCIHVSNNKTMKVRVKALSIFVGCHKASGSVELFTTNRNALMSTSLRLQLFFFFNV